MTVVTKLRRTVVTKLRRTVVTKLRRTVVTKLRMTVVTKLRMTVVTKLRRTVGGLGSRSSRRVTPQENREAVRRTVIKQLSRRRGKRLFRFLLSDRRGPVFSNVLYYFFSP